MTKYLLIETDDEYAAQRIQDYVDLMNGEFDIAIVNTAKNLIKIDGYMGRMVILGRKNKDKYRTQQEDTH